MITIDTNYREAKWRYESLCIFYDSWTWLLSGIR